MTGKAKNKGGRPRSWDALQAHVRLREQVFERMEKMTEAQISAAEGVKYLVARDKKGGKFRHLTEEAAQAILSGENTEDEIVEEWEKVPSTQAYAYLLDQAVGKAADKVQTEHSGTITVKWEGEK